MTRKDDKIWLMRDPLYDGPMGIFTDYMGCESGIVCEPQNGFGLTDRESAEFDALADHLNPPVRPVSG